jgi:methyl-accepting chemotaxis protein
MKIKVFIITLAGFIFILAVSLTVVFFKLSSIENINMDGTTEKLYVENTRIMSLIIHNIPPTSYETLKLPPSWAEIMTVNPENLQIISSTNKSNNGKYIYSIPGLLDQAKGILTQMKNPKPAFIRSKDYMVAVIPYQANTFIIGLKPKTWEKNLINAQSDDMNKASSAITRMLILLACAGILISIVLSFLISIKVSSYLAEFSKSIKALSLGDMNAEPPASKGKDLAVFADSFARIKISLVMALDRLKK